MVGQVNSYQGDKGLATRCIGILQCCSDSNFSIDNRNRRFYYHNYLLPYHLLIDKRTYFFYHRKLIKFIIISVYPERLD